MDVKWRGGLATCVTQTQQYLVVSRHSLLIMSPTATSTLHSPLETRPKQQLVDEMGLDETGIYLYTGSTCTVHTCSMLRSVTLQCNKKLVTYGPCGLVDAAGFGSRLFLFFFLSVLFST